MSKCPLIISVGTVEIKSLLRGNVPNYVIYKAAIAKTVDFAIIKVRNLDAGSSMSNKIKQTRWFKESGENLFSIRATHMCANLI